MLTLIALSAALLQEPSPPPLPQVRTRFMVMGPGGHAAMDRDGDGQITRDEFTAPMVEAFARLDADGDGRIAADEIGDGRGSGEDVMILRGGEPGMHRFELHRPEGAGERHEIFIRGPHGEGGPHTFRFHADEAGPERLDSDGDGRVSEAEFTARLREAFARMDADRSGYLEEGERGGDGEVRVITRRMERRDDD